MNKSDLRVGALIGFKCGGDGYMNAIIYKMNGDVEGVVASFVGRDIMNGTTSLCIGMLRESGDNLVTYNGRVVEKVVYGFITEEDEQMGYFTEKENLAANILAVVQKRGDDYDVFAYEDIDDEKGEEMWLAQELGDIRENIGKILKGNPKFKECYDAIRKSRKICPICGGKTSEKKVGIYHDMRKHIDTLSSKLAVRDSELRSLKAKFDITDKSNKFMEDELKRMRKELENTNEKYINALCENKRLKERGFWARVFNK